MTTTTPEKEDIPRILIVEDDERLAMLTQDYLRRNGLDVAIETDGTRAIRRIISEQPDLVVLDVMLPGSDGLTVCREVRPHYTHPILMLTARTEDMDQVLGLEMGADDYVAKPAQPRVLLARIRALLRRSDTVPTDDTPQRLEFGDLVIDNGGRSVTLNDELNMICCGYWHQMQAAFYLVKIFLKDFVALNMMVKTVPLMCVFLAFAPKLAMTQKTQNASKPYAVKVICLLKKAINCILPLTK